MPPFYLCDRSSFFKHKSEVIEVSEGIIKSGEFHFGLFVAVSETLKELGEDHAYDSCGYDMDKKGRYYLSLDKKYFRLLNKKVADIAMEATDYVVNPRDIELPNTFARNLGDLLSHEE
jgi:hypothetical protein